MNIKTLYRARIEWEARDYKTENKIVDKINDRIFVAQRVNPTLDCILFGGNAACGSYCVFTCPNRKTVEDIYKTISRIIMSHKGSKIS